MNINAWTNVTHMYVDNNEIEFKNIYCDITPELCNNIWQFPHIEISNIYRTVTYTHPHNFKHLVHTIKTIPEPCVFPEKTSGCHDSVKKWIRKTEKTDDKELKKIKNKMSKELQTFSDKLQEISLGFYNKQLVAEQKLMYLSSL